MTDAILNEPTPFAGGSGIIRCRLIGESRNGVQIQADGVVLEEVIVKVRARGSREWQTIELVDGSGPSALVGKDFYLDWVEVSGVPEGEWTFIFRQ